MAEQGPRGGGSGTQQGHYILTASGKLLGFNNNRSLERRMAFIREALAKWEKLPADEKRPGAIEVRPLNASEFDARYHAAPPAGGVVLVASARMLKESGGTLQACSADDHQLGRGHLAAVDRMWIREAEWKELLETGAEGGPVSDRLALRLLRYHLVDFTRGEPSFWERTEIRSQSLRIEPGAKAGSFELSGSAKMATADGKRGFEPSLFGKVEIGAGGQLLRCDLIAVGDHWGEGAYTGPARPGRTPLGIAFRLADPDSRADRLRPQASHWLSLIHI